MSGRQNSGLQRKRQLGVLTDMVNKEHDIYRDVLEYVLMHGGPSVGFEELKTDPLNPKNIAGTLYHAAEALLAEASTIQLPPQRHETVTGVEHSSTASSSPSGPASSLSSSATPRTIAKTVPTAQHSSPLAHMCASNVSSTTSAAASVWMEKQSALLEAAIQFASIATSQSAIDGVLEATEYRPLKRVILDALLYALSVLCRYGLVSSQLVDDTGRTMIEFLVQGTVSIFVNVDMLLDLQFLNATRSCRLADVCRWLHASRRASLVDLAAGLALSVVIFCFPRLPADLSLATASCKHNLDIVRRAYCGYDDCESVVFELRDLARSTRSTCDGEQNRKDFKDCAHLLESARRFFVSKDPSIGDGADASLSSATEAEVLRQRLHPFMIAGAARELHYIATVALRTLETWLSISCEAEILCLENEAAARKGLYSAMDVEFNEICSLRDSSWQAILRSTELHRRCVDMYARESDGRKTIEALYDDRVRSISADLQRLSWYISQFHLRASPAHVFAVPDRLYYLEAAELDSIVSMEQHERMEVSRSERYAFSAFREAWTIDFQFLQQLLAEAVIEAANREAYRKKLLAESHQRHGNVSSLALGSSPASMSGHASPISTTQRYDTGDVGLPYAAYSRPTTRTVVMQPTAPSSHRHVPAEFGSAYNNPHSTAPSSLGFMSGRQSALISASVFAHLSASDYGRAADQQSTAPREGHDALRPSVIHIGARVVSPELSGRRSAMLLEMMQDLEDDQDIERALLEDSESSFRKELHKEFTEGRLVTFDWSMSGYRRLVSDVAKRSAAPSACNVGSGTCSSPLTHSMSPTVVAAHSRLDPERHIPAALRPSTRMAAAAASRAALSASPADVARAIRSIGCVSPQRQHGAEQLTPRPPPSPASVVFSSRPMSRLLQDVLTPHEPVKAKYGSTGAATPNAQLMPRWYATSRLQVQTAEK